MSGEVVSMTPLQYWSRWCLAGAAFLIALGLLLHYVVTAPIVAGCGG